MSAVVRCLFCRSIWSEAHTCARLAARTSGIREVAPEGPLGRLYAFPAGPPPDDDHDLKHQVLAIVNGDTELAATLRCVACENIWTAFRGEGVTCPACGHPGS